MAHGLLHSALGLSSRSTYKRAWLLYRNFLGKYQIAITFPVSSQNLFLFIADLQDKGYAAKTISSYISALGYVHKLSAMPDPTATFLVKKALAAVHKAKPTVDQRMPITKEILHTLTNTLSRSLKDQFNSHLFRAMFLLAFHAFLRVGEITASEHNLALQDVQFSKSGLSLHFRSAKHSVGQKQEVCVQHIPDSTYCPVQALQKYLVLRGNKPGPLFSRANIPITRSEFVQTLSSMLKIAGIPAGNFNSHSFRIGAATSCAANGIADAVIQRLGRWRSDAFKKYIRITNPLQQ